MVRQVTVLAPRRQGHSEPSAERERSSRSRSFLMIAALLTPLALLGSPFRAWALSVNVGGVVITDNGPMDTNSSQFVLDFNSANAGAAGFSVPQGYSVSGTANLVAGGSIIGGGASLDSVVNLTNLTVRRPSGATGGALLIKFSNTFPVAPALPAFAADAIKGSFSNPAGLGAGNNLSFQGFVNAAAITPGAGAYLAAGAAAATTSAFGVGGHGPKSLAGGPPWTVEGDLTVTLATTGDQLNLPNSAEVGINTVPIGPQPAVPAVSPWLTGLLLVVLATSGAAFLYRRRRATSLVGSV